MVDSYTLRSKSSTSKGRGNPLRISMPKGQYIPSIYRAEADTDAAADPMGIGERMGVSYVVEGNVGMDPSTVRIGPNCLTFRQAGFYGWTNSIEP